MSTRFTAQLRANRTAYLLLLPSLCVFALLLIVPLLMTMAGAFSEADAVGRIGRPGTLQNFVNLGSDSRLVPILRQTAIFALLSVAATIVICFPLALVLNQKFPGVTLARALLLLPWAAPLAISAMSWRWIFHDQLGALNYVLQLAGITDANIVWLSEPWLAFGCVIFVEVWSSIPFMTITILAGLQGIPPYIYDAARIDGASPWQEFWSMTVPQMKTVLVIVGLLSVIWAFRSFTIIWTMTQGNPFFRTDISVTYLYKLAFRMMSFGEGYALAFVTFVMLAAFSVLYLMLARDREPGA
ncbi:MAG: ABC transporter permease [Phycisphaeraceae bacterium]|nr:ABC transporter permease [Phycisphaeraceae bacterium]